MRNRMYDPGNTEIKVPEGAEPQIPSSAFLSVHGEKNMTANNPVLLSFGGNLGDVEAAFDSALRELEKNGFHSSACSRVFRSPAMGCEPGAPEFRNRSVLGIWKNSPEELLDLIQRLEVEAGRPADHPHWVSRPLDIDILLMGTLMLNTPRLTIPHPEISKRDFVIFPSAEIAPDLMVPGLGMTFGELAFRRKNSSGSGC